MKKFLTKDTLILVILFALMLAWGPVYQRFFPAPPTTISTLPDQASTQTVTHAEANEPASAKPAEVAPATPKPPVVVELKQAVTKPREPEIQTEISNSLVRLSLSSYGASLTRAELPAFKTSKED